MNTEEENEIETEARDAAYADPPAPLQTAESTQDDQTDAVAAILVVCLDQQTQAATQPQPATRATQADSVRFALGQIVATPGALAALDKAGVGAETLLARHVRGDWGEALEACDRRANEQSLRDQTRLLSSYVLPTGEKVWIVTEADRSTTTLLTPQEY